MKSFLGKMFFIILLVVAGGCNDSASSNANEKTVSKTTDPTTKTTTTPKAKKKKNILFFGDSLTAGYGLEDPSDSYVGVIQEILDSLGLEYKAIASGESGETSSGGKERIDWVLDNYPVDVFILELGANDGLRGIKTEETVKNLKDIFDRVKERYPQAKLIVAGMLAPPNMGADFTKKFAAIFPNLAKEYNAGLVPFLLENVGGIPELNQRDGIHPTPQGHKILAENVWKILKDVL